MIINNLNDLMAAVAYSLNCGDVAALQDLAEIVENWQQAPEEANAQIALIDAAIRAVAELEAA